MRLIKVVQHRERPCGQRNFEYSSITIRAEGVENSLSVVKEVTKRDADTAFTERARMLIKRGYKPKVAVELVLHEMEIEHRNGPRIMEKARSDAEDFLMRVRKGLI